MAAKAKKKKNIFQQYFSNFGIRQICDFLMLGAAVVCLVGFFISNLIITIGLGIFIGAIIISIARSVMVIVSENKRSPEYKNAKINLIIMSVVFVLAAFGFIYSFFI